MLKRTATIKQIRTNNYRLTDIPNSRMVGVKQRIREHLGAIGIIKLVDNDGYNLETGPM